ncbi:MAG TPA: hypothetical protein VLM38_11920 [Blastocatellia bacterium]|nr:hypothetical protein [Blastocatellia bacterium]
MKLSKRILIPGIPGLLLVFSLTTAAQWDKKPYEQWSDKDALKVLNDSPWGKTWTYTSPVTLYKGPVTGRQGVGNQTTDRPVDATHVHFRVRFFSAKPIRQAISRRIELKQKPNDELSDMLKNLVAGEFGEYIVVTMLVESTETGENANQANGLLYGRGNADLITNTYLETKGGKRVFLKEYQKPQKDGFGARFLFPRLVGDQPFISEASEEIHFHTELSSNYKPDLRFKIKDMMYQGKLEY